MRTNYRYVAGIGCVLVLFSAWVTSAELDQALARCAAIRDDARRLSCYDALADSAGGVPAAQVGPEPRQEKLREGLPELGTAAREPSLSLAEPPGNPGRWLGIRPYRRNYILPLSYNSKLNDDPYQDLEGGFRSENLEIKFQLSFELPVWKSILENDLDLYFAYTQLSFFQAYNETFSAPFRDTAYEPELGLNWRPGLTFLDWRLSSLRLALDHQSNGRTEPLSRSWNRLIAQFEAERGRLNLGLRMWQRFQEDAKDDDNPDITSYLGHGEFFAGYDLGPNRFGLMLRNLSDHGTVQLSWSRLLNERMRFYVQYFNGYGESLIDYDRQVHRLGMGFLLNEWP